MARSANVSSGPQRGFNHFDRAGNAGEIRIDDEVVVVYVAPLLAGIAADVARSRPVGLFDLVGGALFVDPVLVHDPLAALFGIGCNEYAEQLFLLPEDVICAASDDDAAAGGGKLADDVRLGEVSLVRHVAVVGEGHAHGGVGAGGNGEQEAPAAVFLLLGDEIRGQAAFLGRHLDDLFIIEGDTELGGEKLADLSAAAAEFTADGDDKIAHVDTSRIRQVWWTAVVLPLYHKGR